LDEKRGIGWPRMTRSAARGRAAPRASAALAEPPERLRDAERSRAAILAAAERLFAERGYEGASLSDIGSAAGLSRGTPGYFFGSKAKLYSEVLSGAFGSRQEAATRAFAAVHAWCEDDGGVELLRDPLLRAANGYMRYLHENPTFVALVMREELDGGERLRHATSSSTAMRDAFSAVHRADRRRGVRSFRVEEAVLLFTVLTFGPYSLRRTLMPRVGIDLRTDAGRRRQARVVADQVLHLISA
jgi:TetR/AcrR family transcriptional regulator